MCRLCFVFFFFFFNDTATTEIYTLSLHDALPISVHMRNRAHAVPHQVRPEPLRSEEHTSELQSLRHLVCRLLLEKKKNNKQQENLQNKNNITLISEQKKSEK